MHDCPKDWYSIDTFCRILYLIYTIVQFTQSRCTECTLQSMFQSWSKNRYHIQNSKGYRDIQMLSCTKINKRKINAIWRGKIVSQHVVPDIKDLWLEQTKTFCLNLLWENESLMGLPAAIGDIKFELLLVITDRFAPPGCRTLGVIESEWDPPRPSLKLLIISRYCLCMERQTLSRERNPSSLPNKISLFAFLLPFDFVRWAEWLEEKSISSWTFVQSLSSSKIVVLDSM